MKSVRLLTTSEPDGGCRLAEGMVKRITGEDVVTARLLYKASFDYKEVEREIHIPTGDFIQKLHPAGAFRRRVILHRRDHREHILP